MASVYLAGPITGLSFQGATDWRTYARNKLDSAGIQGISPMRGKSYLRHEEELQDHYTQHVMSSTKAILTRDHFDVKRCDAVLANLLLAERVSIGTVMEIAFAHAYDKPVILVMEDGNLHEHAFVNECAMARVDSLDAGLELACYLLATHRFYGGHF